LADLNRGDLNHWDLNQMIFCQKYRGLNHSCCILWIPFMQTYLTQA